MRLVLAGLLAAVSTASWGQSMPIMTQTSGMAAGYQWEATGGQPLIAARPAGPKAFCFFRSASVIYFDGAFYAVNGIARARVGNAVIRYMGRNHQLLDDPPERAEINLSPGQYVDAANKACGM